MTDLHDLKLDKWHGSVEPEPGGFRWGIVAIVVILAGLAAAAYFLFWRQPQPKPAEVRAQTEQAVAPAATTKPLPEPGDHIDLPPLEQTDPVVRDLVGRLSQHPKVLAWLATDQLIRNFTVTVFNMAGGQNPSQHLARFRPRDKFQIVERGSQISIDPRSYRRYDAYADAVAGLDARGAARLYATLKPRIQDSYRELGQPDGNFDPVMERAIVELLKTPVIDGDVALASKSVAYEFADPRLQSLSPVQRQFLRMGPRNVRLIQAKLREIAPMLGIALEPAPRQ
jgi:Protein of unknown function (DUF3014)